jgi:hypothetical protein
MPVAHSPKGVMACLPNAQAGGSGAAEDLATPRLTNTGEKEPLPPADGDRYTKAEIASLSPSERQ